MRIETETIKRVIVEVGEQVYVTESAVDAAWDSDAIVGVATVLEPVDDQHEVKLGTEDGATFWVKAALLKPYYEFPLEIIDDEAGHDFPLGTRVRLVQGVGYEGGRYFLATTLDDIDSPEWDEESTRNVFPEDVATAADAYAPLVKVPTIPAAGTRIVATYCVGFEDYPDLRGVVLETQRQAYKGRVLFRVDGGQWPGGSALWADEWHQEEALSEYALSDEIEGPVYVLDVEGLEALRSGSVVRTVRSGQYPFAKRGDGRWYGTFSELSTHPTADIILPAEVLFAR